LIFLSLIVINHNILLSPVVINPWMGSLLPSCPPFFLFLLRQLYREFHYDIYIYISIYLYIYIDRYTHTHTHTHTHTYIITGIGSSPPLFSFLL
jgi:hypothetical protein